MTAERGGIPQDDFLLSALASARREKANGNSEPMKIFNASLDQLPEERLQILIPRFRALSQGTNNKSQPHVPESAMATPGELNPFD